MAVMDRKASVRAGAAAKAEKRKKIILAAGCVILLAVLAIEIPSTLKRLHSSSGAAAPPATLPGQTTTTTISTPGATSSPLPSRAQRRALSQLKVHDPFAPAIKVSNGVLPPATTSAPPKTAPPASGGKTSAGEAAKATTSPATATPAGPIGFTAPNAAPAVTVAPAAAIIFVNGKAQTVGLKQLFPLKAPAFKLVAVDRNTMKIRVAGGSFTGGRASITLKRGRAVTLVNTTTGVRYVIRFATPLAALPTTQTPTTTATTQKSTTSK